jgi:hypothetical protein
MHRHRAGPSLRAESRTACTSESRWRRLTRLEGHGGSEDRKTNRLGGARKILEAHAAHPNLGPLARGHHRAKTFGDWQLHQPLAGLYLWRTPTRYWFRVDHITIDRAA